MDIKHASACALELFLSSLLFSFEQIATESK
jgi:hypothetical protein